MVAGSERLAGSAADFEDDWRYVLDSSDGRYYVFPSLYTGTQADLVEWIKVQQILKLLRETGTTQGRVLEYGCGAAGVSLYLAESGFEAHICDLSTGALEVAQRNQQRNAPGAELRSSAVANGLQLPYTSNSFDIVMSFGLLEHFEGDALRLLLDETVRVLKPDGLFIADIVPGLGRYNARTVGTVASYLASALAHFFTGRWRKMSSLHQSYFFHYYENTLDDGEWSLTLNRHGLEDVAVDVCRPFPPLAISGPAERLYTRLIAALLPLHRRFDGANNWFTRRWGWMYLATARKAQVQID